MNIQNVEWLKSQKGTPLLTIDKYIFKNNGKGKSADVRYWICRGCDVTAHTTDNIVDKLIGNHEHPNHSIEIANLKMKVRI